MRQTGQARHRRQRDTTQAGGVQRAAHHPGTHPARRSTHDVDHAYRSTVVSAYHRRSAGLPSPSQMYLALPGVRPARGRCPSCFAGEDAYCAPLCTLTDPYGTDLAHLRRCRTCERVARVHEIATDGPQMILPGRSVRHLLDLLDPDPEESLCRHATADRADLVSGIVW